MMYEELVSDFATRTRENLAVIRALQHQGQKVYEVTALMNSMLGLLVFPQQSYVQAIPETPLSELQGQGWPLPRVRGRFRQVRTLREMVRYLRNAVAHCNLKFTADSHGEIAGLIVWNTYQRKKTWEAELTLEDLDGIADRFSRLLSDRRTWRV